MNFSVNFPLFSVVLCLMSAVISCVLPGRAARRLSLALSLAVSITSGILFAHILRTGHYPLIVCRRFLRAAQTSRADTNTP